MAQESEPLRYLAFYLPQYHPIPENDAWWGAGFTEWTNVRAARPRFAGHEQPQEPAAELGFYDLRDPDTRVLHAELARSHGVDGFVYYHYWFEGRRLLELPFDEVLSSSEPSLPFCLCWANESWTRSWDGRSGEVLIRQTYSPDDDVRHIRWLAEAFADPRYLRVNGRPLFLVYRATELADPLATTERWRAECVRLGLPEPYLCRVESFAGERGDPQAIGFDAAVEFQPNWYEKGPPLPAMSQRFTAAELLDREASGVFSYPVASTLAMQRPAVTYKRYRCVMPGWDNSPRRVSAPTIFVGSTPSRYERWLRSVSSSFVPYSEDENLVFVNAWNEWGESNHLEPDTRWGRGFLDAHLRATRALADPPVTPADDELVVRLETGALLALEGAVRDLTERVRLQSAEIDAANAVLGTRIVRAGRRLWQLDAWVRRTLRL